jgi:hypothetical protein
MRLNAVSVRESMTSKRERATSAPPVKRKRERAMTKKRATCKACGSSDALYVELRNGEKLPSYVMRIGDGIYCNPCAGEDK